jgi:hypothetical protein
MFNTGITIRGFEVWACEPDHYRHYHTLFLRLPQEFPTEIREYEWLDRTYWKIAFDRPDGVEQVVYGTLRSRAEAEKAHQTWTNAQTGRVGCQFEVGYKKTDAAGNYLPSAFCDATAPTAKPWGTTWADPKFDCAPLKFDLTPEEALTTIEWRNQADAAWFAAHPHFLENERRRTRAEAEFAASLGSLLYEG